MKFFFPLLFFYSLCQVASGQSLEPIILTNLKVPDSIAEMDNEILLKKLQKTVDYHINAADSLEMEVAAKSLIERYLRKENLKELIPVYIELSELRTWDLEILDLSIKLSKRYDDFKSLAYAYSVKSSLHFNRNEYQYSYEIAQLGYDLSKKNGDIANKWNFKYIMSLIQTELGESEKGINGLKELESIYIDGRARKVFYSDTDLFNRLRINDIQYSIALASYEINNLTQAIFYIDKVGNYASEYSDSDYFDMYLVAP